MTTRALTTLLLTTSLTGFAAPLLAQAPPPVVSPKTLKAAPWAPGAGSGEQRPGDGNRAEFENQNAYQTQQHLWRVMRTYPPAVGEILQRDPTLLEKADYMA